MVTITQLNRTSIFQGEFNPFFWGLSQQFYGDVYIYIYHGIQQDTLPVPTTICQTCVWCLIPWEYPSHGNSCWGGRLAYSVHPHRGKTGYVVRLWSSKILNFDPDPFGPYFIIWILWEMSTSFVVSKPVQANVTSMYNPYANGCRIIATVALLTRYQRLWKQWSPRMLVSHCSGFGSPGTFSARSEAPKLCSAIIRTFHTKLGPNLYLDLHHI